MTQLLRAAVCAGGVVFACALAGCDSQELPELGSTSGAVNVPGAAGSATQGSNARQQDTSADPDATSAAASVPASEPSLPKTGATPPTTDASAANSRPAGQTPAARAPVRSAGGIQEVTFDTIKLPLEKDQPFERSLLTTSVIDLDGQAIRIRGYILPTSVFRQTGITQFVLVRDNQQCCFGPGAALHDCIVVEMKPGRAADYTIRPVSVEGRFSLAEMINPDDGRHLAIYHLDGEKVQ